MAIDGKKDSPERGRTDESLRTERQKTDRALAEKQESIAEDADLVLQRARDSADAVLVAAREKADEQLDLITNSIKFTASGGSIVLRAERARDQLRFSIRDTGSGIPADKLEAIFERFWQVGKNDRRGVGLGLYISRCIVEAHGGRIWAESTLGVGSTLCFTLPVAPVSVRRDALTSASVAPG
jgi:signal transduction histidine kinase